MVESDESALLTSEHIAVLLGQRLEACRLAANISQAQVAAAAGVSRRTITRLENGHGVSLDTFIRVAQQLGLVDNMLASLPSEQVLPIDRVRLNGKRRRRARPSADSPSAETRLNSAGTTWTWGDEPMSGEEAT